MSQKLKSKFESEINGQAVTLAVVRPTPKVSARGQQVHNRAFKEAIDSGAILRAKVEGVIREQKLWDDARQAEYEAAQKRLADGERKLAKGGIKLSDAKQVAVQMRRDRNKLRDLSSERNVIDGHTAEAQAENARFNYYVSACTVYDETGKPVFADVDDYTTRSGEPAALEAAGRLAMMLYGLDEGFEKKLPENKFLVKYGFAREKDLHLVNKDGHTVDASGRLVDDEGRYVGYENDAAGEKVRYFVDGEGNRVDADGDYVLEFSEFIDDDAPAAAPAA